MSATATGGASGGAGGDVLLALDERVATVTLNRPAVRNAVSHAMWVELARLFAELGRERDVRGVILTGAGGDFTVGADISEFERHRADSSESAAYEAAVDAAASAIAEAPKPVIAAIHGYCLGGGCHLALACDFRFAAPQSRLGIPAARLSIVYGVRSTQRLMALVGLSGAKRMLYGAERVDAAEAARIGLVDRIAEDPLAEASILLAELAENAPLSIAGAKAILTGLSMGPGALDEAQARSLIDAASDSEDFTEGRRAFAEKRRPVFKGR